MDIHELLSGTSVLVPKKMSRIDTFPYRMASGGGINLFNGYDEASLPVTRSSDSLTRFFTSYEMGAPSRIPFTLAQWQELERQTLIYKCIMASVPVPHDLLFSVVKCVTENPAFNPNVFDLKLSKGVDPEPGRCRRTDGKKWRCSRNAAPDQKYCERHMHRGRPRSRKPVEDQAKVNTSINRPLATVKAPVSPVSNFSLNQTFGFPTKPDSKPSFKADEDSRYLHWTKAEAITDMCETQQWQRLDSKLPSVLIPYGNTFDLNFSGNEDANAQSIQNKAKNPNNFIDAWSEEATLNRSPVSSLSLSLQGTDDLNPIQMGLNVDNPESINGGNDSQSLSWLTQSFSCAGPLGEVFQRSNSSSPRDAGDAGEDNSLSGINLMGEVTDSSGATSPTVN